MPFRPDSENNYRKEAIFQSSPLLQAFLDDRADYAMWRAVVLNEMQALEYKLIEKTNRETLTYTLKSLVLVYKSLRLFHPDSTSDSRLETVKYVTFLGYEIGNIADAELFLIDICQQLLQLSALNTGLIPDVVQRIMLLDSVIGLLTVGTHFEDFDSADSDDDIPPAFKDFIHGLF